MEDKIGVQMQLPIRSFKDTGWVAHGFSNNSQVRACVVETSDSGGYGIRLTVSDGEETVCDFTMDRFAAMCMVDCLVKNILNQEELQQ